MTPVTPHPSPPRLPFPSLSPKGRGANCPLPFRERDRVRVENRKDVNKAWLPQATEIGVRIL